MKKDIHPTYYKDAKVTCACGNSFVTGSSEKEIKTELCSMCHPFFTGKQKIMDTARRVEKFKDRLAKKTTTGSKKKTVKRKVKDQKKKTKK
ncbi:MAG TPA: 50S ribosomal protein L31 [Candidatus Bipolaricaulota bacterium]|nr:50S ribosomal protein L31 [Candidatus Bipolaricaulota bacterium]